MKVLALEVTGPSRLNVRFSDGFCGEIDLEPTFSPDDAMRDPAVFARAMCNGLTVEWPGGIDYCPDTLRAWCEAGRIVTLEENHAESA